MIGHGFRLGVDFGTFNTVAALADAGGSVRPLLFDSSPLLASAVFADARAGLLVGSDAVRAAVGAPGRFEANPKRRIDEGTVWLGDAEYPVVDLIAAVLRRVRAEAWRVSGSPAVEVVLTHPATWGSTRLELLAEAARRAGLGSVRFVPEPVAAAAYYATMLGRSVPPGHSIVVYDLGAGTFDVSVVRPSPGQAPGGFEVAGCDGLTDVGGLDLDAAVVDHARTHTADAANEWKRLDWPQRPADIQARQTLWHAARAVKEQLSRHAAADLHLPLVDRQIHLTRQEFETAVAALLNRTATVTFNLVRSVGVPRERVAGVFLVGGSSHIPLIATLLHRTLGIAPTTIDQPQLVVAEGAVHMRPAGAAVASPPPPKASARPVSAEARPAPAPHPAPRRRAAVAWVALLAIAIVAGAVLAVTQPWRGTNEFRPPSQSASGQTTASLVFPAEFGGTWTGTLEQSDGSADEMELAITPNAGTAQVRYPDADCRGTLTVLSRDGTTIRTQESILNGRCTPTGTMTLQLQSTNQIAADYKPDIASYTASAVLTRR